MSTGVESRISRIEREVGGDDQGGAIHMHIFGEDGNPEECVTCKWRREAGQEPILLKDYVIELVPARKPGELN